MADTNWRTETKPCARCGVSFGPPLRQSPSSWARRRYCSIGCARGALPVQDRRRRCFQCGAAYWATYREQRFCGGDCYEVWRADERARQRQGRHDG